MMNDYLYEEYIKNQIEIDKVMKFTFNSKSDCIKLKYQINRSLWYLDITIQEKDSKWVLTIKDNRLTQEEKENILKVI